MTGGWPQGAFQPFSVQPPPPLAQVKSLRDQLPALIDSVFGGLEGNILQGLKDIMASIYNMDGQWIGPICVDLALNVRSFFEDVSIGPCGGGGSERVRISQLDQIQVLLARNSFSSAGQGPLQEVAPSVWPVWCGGLVRVLD